MNILLVQESIYVAFATCIVQQLRPRYILLDVVGGHLHSSVCMVRCGLPAAFVWLCKPETIEDPIHAVRRHGCK